MIVEIRSLSLDGSPLDSEIDIYTGVTAEDIVQAMKSATMFGARLSVDEYIDHVQRAAWEHACVELCVKGSTTAERAASLLSGLIETKLARVLGDEPPTKKGISP